MTVRIEFGNATDVQRKLRLLAPVNIEVGLKTRPYFRKDAHTFDACSGLDSEYALCCVRWSFVRKEEVHFVIESDVITEIVGESTTRTCTISEVTTSGAKNLSTNLVGGDFLVIRNSLDLRLRNQATEAQHDCTRCDDEKLSHNDFSDWLLR